MRNALMVFAAVLAGLFLFLSVIDKSDYALEKQLWRVQKLVTTISREPGLVPEKNFENVIAMYQKLIDRYPDSDLVPEIYLQIGRLNVSRKAYQKARDAFGEIRKRYPDKDELVAKAMLNIGHAYEGEKNEAEAIATYRRIWEQYPRTGVGMNVPLYIANYYLQNKDEGNARSALQEAVSYYKTLAAGSPNTQAGFDALRMLATGYIAQKDWEEALNTLQGILMDYATARFLSSEQAAQLIHLVNAIAVTRLEDPARAVSIYVQFIARYPKHPLVPYLTKTINGLQAGAAARDNASGTGL